MSNTYYKVMNSNLSLSYSNNVVCSLQNDLSGVAKLLNDDLYNAVEAIHSGACKGKEMDVNVLLKYYTITQLLKDTEKTNSVYLPKKEILKYRITANPNYKYNTKENVYYRYNPEDEKWHADKNVIAVNEDGTYVKTEMMGHSLYKLKKIYDKDDDVLGIKVINPSGEVVKNKCEAVELLGMRKEYVERYKYSGFSGNSYDVVNRLRNKILPPIETGYYMDKWYHLYNWNDFEKCFVRNKNLERMSPLLTDYDFQNSNKVIRKEYKGVA